MSRADGPPRSKFHTVDAVIGIDQRLRRNAADTSGDMRTRAPTAKKRVATRQFPNWPVKLSRAMIDQVISALFV